MALAPAPVHRFTVEEFLALAATDPDRWKRSELINGEIWDAMPETEKHAGLVESIAASLREKYAGAGHLVRTNGSVRLDGDGMPLPDVYVVRAGETTEDYWEGTQLLLVVEVALSTKRYDIGGKAAAYGRGGVPLYFVVQQRTDGTLYVDAYTTNEGGRYRAMTQCSIEDISAG